jgi:hypothetical protein
MTGVGPDGPQPRAAFSMTMPSPPSRSRNAIGSDCRSAPNTPIPQQTVPAIRRLLITILAIGIVLITGFAAVAPAAASASVTLDGSFSTVIAKPDFTSHCPSGVVDDGECGTMQVTGLGTADWAYAFGPAFEPNGRCFDVDGTFTITLQSDGSSISGPLIGLFCPRSSDTAHQHVGLISYGNPFVEDDSIAFTGGTGQFAGLSGTASFHTFGAGARFTGTLKGTLTG